LGEFRDYEETSMLNRAILMAGACLMLAPSIAACGDGAVRAESASAAVQSKIAWRQCPGGQGDVQCGTVSVPLDWSRPRGRRIQIAIVRRAVTQPSRRIGTLVFLPGGPGQSGVDTVAGQPDFGGLEKRFDIVSLDPRGVGKSSPLTCPTRQIMTAVGTRLPRTDRELAMLRERNRALADACRKATGPVFDHLDTASAARDLDAVRTALGERKISLYGHSYGTLLGQQYAAMFGAHVRAAVLDGTMDHSAPRRRFAVTAANAFDESFDQFARWCARTSSCALHGSRPADVYRRVVAKAQNGELAGTDGSGFKWTPFLVAGQVDAMLWTPSWSATASFLKTLDAGKPWPSDPEGELPATMNYADPIVCQDFAMGYPNGSALRGDLKTSAIAAPLVGYSPNAMKSILTCQGWASPVRNPQSKATSTTAAPMLLVESRYDNATPAAWSRQVARQLGPKARLVILRDWTHGMKVFTPGCESKMVNDYLDGLRLPDAAVRCGSTPPTS
jgi:pimeloyl-ACP methyl ester carboxylesterase